MARYFFHLCDGQDVLMDPDGREIIDASDIPSIALKEARVCISEDVLEGRIHLEQTIEVRDRNGRLVHSIHFRDAVTDRNGGQA